MARILQLTLNGRARTDAVPDNVLLLDYLREIVGLTGTKTGCDGGECGACTILVDDQPRLSCLTLAAMVDGCTRCSAGSTKSSAPNAAIARRDSSWLRPDCCGATRIRAKTRFAKRSAA